MSLPDTARERPEPARESKEFGMADHDLTGTLPRRPATLPALTGMRWVAAMLVFATHISLSWIFPGEGVNEALAEYVSTLGFIGVQFFFILSGFVLTWSARPGDHWRGFWRRRMVKILPNHLVTWLAGLILMAGAGVALTAKAAIPSLLLIKPWFPDFTVVVGINGPSWSIAVELIFYLSFPWLLVLVNRIRPERLWLWAGMLFAGIVAIPFIATLLPDNPRVDLYDVSWWKYWFVNFLPPSRVFEFVIGMVMARIVMTGRYLRLPLPLALLTVVPGYLVTLWLPSPFDMVVPCVIPLALVVASAATADVAGREGFFASRPMVWLGEISFAFYMVHMLVLYYGPMKFGSGRQWELLPALGIVALSFVIALGLAWLLYRLVEIPAMLRWSRTRRSPDATDERLPLVDSHKQ